MVSEDDILLKQSEELLKYRKRSKESIASSYNAYTTLLPILAAAIGFLIKANGGDFINDNLWIGLFLTGIVVFVYGCYIHHLLISSHINLTIYTKKINLTRGYLITNKKMKNKILLPYTPKEPEFGKQGFLEENFSKMGVVAFMRWVNSFILFLSSTILFFILLTIYTNIWTTPYCSPYIISIFLGIIFGYVSHTCHQNHYNEKLKEAEDKWKNEIKDKKYLLLDKK